MWRNHHSIPFVLLVCLGFYNRSLFLTVLDAGKSMIKAPADSVSGEHSLPGAQTALFAMSSRSRKVAQALWDHFYKGPGPAHEGSTLMI